MTSRPSPLPPRRRDTRTLADLIRQDRVNLGQLGRGMVGGRFPPARPLGAAAQLGEVSGEEPDDNDPVWEDGDRHTVTTPGTQTMLLTYEPIEESLLIRWHPGGASRAGLPQTSPEDWTLDGQTVTIPDPAGILAAGDVISAQYQHLYLEPDPPCDYTWTPGSAYQPLAGADTAVCDAIRDPHSDKAVWVALVGGDWQCYQTIGDWSTLAGTSSVTYLGSITSGLGLIGGNGHQCTLTVIGHTIYATWSGKSSGHAYTRIARSADGGRTWYPHATLPSDGPHAGSPIFFGRWGSEIAVDPGSGLWCVVHPIWTGTSIATQRMGVSTSADQGRTWTNRISAGWYAGGGAYGYGGTRQWAKWGGKWFLGGRGDVDAGQHWQTSDFTTFDALGDLGYGNSACLLTTVASDLTLFGYTPYATPERWRTTRDTSPVGATWATFTGLNAAVYASDTHPTFRNLNPGGDCSEQSWVAVGNNHVQALT